MVTMFLSFLIVVILVIVTRLTFIAMRAKTCRGAESDDEKKYRIARASFRVRTSNLLALSGRGIRDGKKKIKYSKLGYSKVDSHENITVVKFLDSLKEIVSFLINIISFGYVNLTGSNGKKTSNFLHFSQQSSKSSHLPPSQDPPIVCMNGYYDNIKIVGLDCEMVGGGRGGEKSLLARCSVVTLEPMTIEVIEKLFYQNRSCSKNRESKTLTQNLVVLYDKYVVPKERVTDYRTQYSGITKDTYTSKKGIPIVSFHLCQREISELLSSIEGKQVLVVGHALENDFDALEIKHPDALTRDTAFFRPYMRLVRKQSLPRKLSSLCSEELGITIQQKVYLASHDGETEVNQIKRTSLIGHSSVEDAAAALRLYWHKYSEWERSLNYPFVSQRIADTLPRSKMRPQINCMYLDCCNLPLGLRGVDFKELLLQEKSEITIPSKGIRLISKEKKIRNCNYSDGSTTIDWIPIIQSTLCPISRPQIIESSLIFDGAKFRDISKHRSVKDNFVTQTQQIILESPSNHGSIKIEITKDWVSADDKIVEKCVVGANDQCSHSKIISLNEAVHMLSFSDDGKNCHFLGTFYNTTLDNDHLDYYIVIRRKAGGSKTNSRVFHKLNLRRRMEGALCLSGLTKSMQKDSWQIARMLLCEHSVEKLIECELRKRDELQYIVVTDDIFLTERLIRMGTVLILNYRQLRSMLL